MIRSVRRIVTGRDAKGRSYVLRDEPASNRWIKQEWPGLGATMLWASDTVPADNSGDRDATERPFQAEPSPGGVGFMMVQFPPESDLDAMTPEQRAIIKDPSAGGLKAVEVITDDAPAGMHTTATLDYDILVSGRLTLILDHGEVELSPGDTVVMRGDRHTWENRGTEPAVLAVIMVDASSAAHDTHG